MTCPTQFADVAAALAANGYRPVPILAGSKRPPITDWQHFEFAQGCERRFGDCGAGVLLGDVVALDIDVDDADAAAAIEQATLEIVGLGDAATIPRRIGRAPRVLIPFRTAHPFSKLKSKSYQMCSNNSAAHVEVLASGQQFVAYHVHPDTRLPYQWNGGGDLIAVPRDALPEITERQAQLVIASANEILAEWGDRIDDASRDEHGAADDVATQRRSSKERETIPSQVSPVRCTAGA